MPNYGSQLQTNTKAFLHEKQTFETHKGGGWVKFANKVELVVLEQAGSQASLEPCVALYRCHFVGEPVPVADDSQFVGASVVQRPDKGGVKRERVFVGSTPSGCGLEKAWGDDGFTPYNPSALVI